MIVLLCNIEPDEKPCDILIRRLPRQPSGSDAAVAVHIVTSGSDALLQFRLHHVRVVEFHVWKDKNKGQLSRDIWI